MGNIGLQCMMLAFIFTVCFSSCKDDKDTTAALMIQVNQ